MATITTTVLEVVSTGQEFSIPGDYTPEQLVTTYGANVPGLASMQSEVSVSGSTKRVTFRPRTGNKG